jgi:hypothetical protein
MRPAIRTPLPGATAAITAPPQKIATPPSITFLRPNRSPSVPPVSIRAANASM